MIMLIRVCKLRPEEDDGQLRGQPTGEMIDLRETRHHGLEETNETRQVSLKRRKSVKLNVVRAKRRPVGQSSSLRLARLA